MVFPRAVVAAIIARNEKSVELWGSDRKMSTVFLKERGFYDTRIS